MASSGDGIGHFSSTSLVQREAATIQVDDGSIGRGSRTRHVLNVEITENFAVLAGEEWESTKS
jgi:hypothetical protein